MFRVVNGYGCHGDQIMRALGHNAHNVCEWCAPCFDSCDFSVPKTENAVSNPLLATKSCSLGARSNFCFCNSVIVYDVYVLYCARSCYLTGVLLMGMYGR